LSEARKVTGTAAVSSRLKITTTISGQYGTIEIHGF